MLIESDIIREKINIYVMSLKEKEENLIKRIRELELGKELTKDEELYFKDWPIAEIVNFNKKLAYSLIDQITGVNDIIKILNKIELTEMDKIAKELNKEAN